MKKRALVTGITGQDGAYLAQLLLKKGYEVHGIVRRTSLPNGERIVLFKDELHLHDGDLTDGASLGRAVAASRPDEIYNLGAQSHVMVSFEAPEVTAQINALGTLRLLEAIRTLGLAKTTRFYQASTSELYGKVQETPQRETTPFYPRSPYGAAKLYAYWMTVNFREAYGLFASNGILFNHESPLRGENFVTRKITKALGRILFGLQKKLLLGNLDAKRDWGHAKDSSEAIWRILQHESPDDFVIATGEQHTVRTFVTLAASAIGIELRWEGSGLQEHAVIASLRSTLRHSLRVGQRIVAIDPQLFRPAEVMSLLGDSSKARTLLGWRPKVSFEAMVEEMAVCDLERAQHEASCHVAPLP